MAGLEVFNCLAPTSKNALDNETPFATLSLLTHIRQEITKMVVTAPLFHYLDSAC
jgi:hypothetical protein